MGTVPAGQPRTEVTMAMAADADGEEGGKRRTKTQTRLELRQLGGSQKAATIIMAIGEERAAKLFEKMDDEEIKELQSRG